MSAAAFVAVAALVFSAGVVAEYAWLTRLWRKRPPQ